MLGLALTRLLAWFLRHRRISFPPALLTALCFAGMLAVFAFGNQPVNLQVASWTRSALPANWCTLRDAWNGFHAASSTLAMLAFILLLLAILHDTQPSQSLMEKPKAQRNN